MARERLEAATGPAERAGAEVSMRGMAVDIGDEQPAPIGELIGVAAALLLLTLLFRSVVAMAVTLVAAVFGLVAGMTLVALASAGVEIPTVAPTIGVMLGLGAGIDYALFLVARHRERLAAGDDVETAAANANGTTGVARADRRSDRGGGDQRPAGRRHPVRRAHGPRRRRRGRGDRGGRRHGDAGAARHGRPSCAQPA